MQFQPPAVIVVLQEICQIAHDMEMGIDWIAHGENASRKVIMFLVFPVCPLQRRSEEHTSELQSLMRISYAVFCLKKKNKYAYHITTYDYIQQIQYQYQHIQHEY